MMPLKPQYQLTLTSECTKMFTFLGNGAFFILLFSTKMSTNPTNTAVKPLAHGSWFHLSIEIDVISTVDKSTDQGKLLSIY